LYEEGAKELALAPVGLAQGALKRKQIKSDVYLADYH
jgi:hypothetical protein